MPLMPPAAAPAPVEEWYYKKGIKETATEKPGIEFYLLSFYFQTNINKTILHHVLGKYKQFICYMWARLEHSITSLWFIEEITVD